MRRYGDGVGDWLFMLTCIKHFNAQHPDVEVFVDFTLDVRRAMARKLPSIIREAYYASDVLFSEHGVDVVPGYDVVVPHAIYTFFHAGAVGPPYVESMLERLGALTGRPMRYDPQCVPHFEVSHVDCAAGQYLATVSCGKKQTAHKDWAPRNFSELAALVARNLKTPVAQLGSVGDWPIAAPVISFLGLPFATVAGVLAGASCFVGIENGLAVLALMIGTPTLVIYRNERNMPRLVHPKLTKLLNPEVPAVFDYVKEKLEC